MKRILSALAAFALSGAALSPAGVSAAESAFYQSEIAKAAAEYENDKRRCETLQGNDRDVCLQRAASNLKVAESDLKAYERNTSAAGLKAERERIGQSYKVDKEKCDVYKGNSKDICIAQADAVKMRREGNLKALESRLEGDYKLAIERCENYSGDRRSACKDEAKRLYKH
jgi:hypothetical protein